MPKLSSGPAGFISVGRAEVRVEHAGWTVCIDAPVSRSRGDNLVSDVRRLVAILQTGDPSKIDRGFFEALFGGHFAAIAHDRNQGRIYVLRDVAGAKTIYHATNNETLFVGNVQSELAQALPNAQICLQSARVMMALDYYLDGTTQYSQISEVPMGTVMASNSERALATYAQFDLSLCHDENGMSQSCNARLLRDGILKAHENRVGSDNIVLLSGGIDSSVMLAALRAIVNPSRLRAVSFKVKGTSEDETVYSARLAKALDVPIEVIEVDPMDEAHFAHFEDDLEAMNNPYVGRFIYGNLQGGPDSVFFAGQDTRLHTPDLNRLDQFAFSLLPLQRGRITRSIARSLVALMLAPITAIDGKYAEAPRWRRGLHRAALAPDLELYVQRFLFNIDEGRLSELGIDDESAEKCVKSVAVDCSSAGNARDLYNQIVARRWLTQWTDDMRYLQDLGRLNGTHVALPFYDVALARLSSGLPMKQTTRFVEGKGKFDTSRTRVNKALLREAFSSELPLDLLMRAKAVSRTQHLMYSGVMGRKIRGILAADLMRGTDGVVSRLGVTDYVGSFISMNRYRPEDEAFLGRVFRIAALVNAGRKYDS